MTTVPLVPPVGEHETGTEPVLSVLIPCLDPDGKSPWMRRADGAGRLPRVCGGCGSEVARAEPPEVDRPEYRAWRAVGHLRWQHTYAVTDAVSCSCGGWHGTPVSIERQLTGAETLILSFQGKVDDIEHNQAQSVDLLCQLNEKLDRLLAVLETP